MTLEAEQIVAVITPLMKAKSFMVRAQNSRKQNIDVVFENVGFMTAFTDISRACGYLEPTKNS